ncbi:MAG: hypothetical protein QXE38_01590 [Candidatus Methanomethylicia archaeon]
MELHGLLRDKSLALRVAKYIDERCFKSRYLIMHVCGTQPFKAGRYMNIQ